MIAGKDVYKRQAQRIINDPAFFGNADADWLDLVLRTGTSQNVDVSVAGGGADSRYYTSLSYTGQDGTLIGTDFMRISGKISLDTDVSNYFRLYTNLNFGYTKNNKMCIRDRLVTLPEDRKYFNSPSVYRGSTPKGGGSLKNAF